MTKKINISERVYDTAVTRYVNAELERMSLNNKSDLLFKTISTFIPIFMWLFFAITIAGLTSLDNFK